MAAVVSPQRLLPPTPSGGLVCPTALGWVALGWTTHGICRSSLFLESEARARAELAGWGAGQAVAPPFVAAAVLALDRYARGEPAALAPDTIPLDLPHSEAGRTVLALVRAIPPGETRTYSRIAQEAGLGAGAARAVGRFMATNPVPPFVPCHRVVGADGSLTGFAGGLAMKRRLLQLEGALPAALL